MVNTAFALAVAVPSVVTTVKLSVTAFAPVSPSSKASVAALLLSNKYPTTPVDTVNVASPYVPAFV